MGTRRDACRDRIDVWLPVYADVSAPRAWALLEDACRLTGHFLRDPDVISALQADTPIEAHAFHRACWVACGLLEHGPTDAEIASVTTVSDACGLLFATLLAWPAVLRESLERRRHAWSHAPKLAALANAALMHVRCDEPLLLLE
ncbi:MAG TPA: hypothetical protein VGT98_03050 [Candidatus Elarobacter sp.]|nr:hypothetical protein [Candidatus Elarobacter sp.]